MKIDELHIPANWQPKRTPLEVLDKLTEQVRATRGLSEEAERRIAVHRARLIQLRKENG